MDEIINNGIVYRVGDTVYINKDKFNKDWMSRGLKDALIRHGLDSPLIIEALVPNSSVRLRGIPACCNLKRLMKTSLTTTTEENVMVNKHKVKDNQYSFTITHPKALDLVLLSKECTRENPLLIIRVGNEYKFLIHKSIYDKADVCGIRTSLWMRSSVSEKEIGSIVDWVKKVINAPWPDNKPVKVIVTKVKL